MHLRFLSLSRADWNNYTGECVWEQPEGYKEVNYTLLMAMAKNQKSELWAAILVQKTWRAKKARGTVRAERGAQSGGTGWEEIMDPGSGMPSVESFSGTPDVPEKRLRCTAPACLLIAARALRCS